MWLHVTSAIVAVAAISVIAIRPDAVASVPGLAALLVTLASSVMAARQTRPWDGVDRRKSDDEQGI